MPADSRSAPSFGEEGVPVLVFESDAEAASALLKADDGSQEQGA
jgi:hypothetical protein